MGSVSKRIQAEMEALRAENAALKRETVRLQHECRLAYLEGLDQGTMAVAA